MEEELKQLPVHIPQKQQELSLEQKTDISATIFYTIKRSMIERFSAAMLQVAEDEYEFTMSWFPKRGGRQAQLIVSVNELGGVRLEFTRNTIEGISCKYQGKNADIKLLNGTHIRIKNNLEKTRMHVNVYPDTVYSPSRTNEQLIMDLIHTILMA
jgi:hypothetical protein